MYSYNEVDFTLYCTNDAYISLILTSLCGDGSIAILRSTFFQPDEISDFNLRVIIFIMFQ